MTLFATLKASDLADHLDVVAFRGTEALCRPFHFDVHVALRNGTAVDMAKAIGSHATLTMQRERDAPFVFHGMLAEVRLTLHTGEAALYQVLLVPRLWQLGLSRRSRVFTKQSVPDIIKSVLEDSGLSSADYELRLQGNYSAEELVVQYQESNLDFLHRWMEREGLYYFFEHGDSDEKLIITDHRAAHDKLVDKQVRYFPLADRDESAGECLDAFAVVHSALPARVRQADYDYARPMLDVSSTADVSTHGFGTVSTHAGRFFDPEQAKRYASLRAEELKAREVVAQGSGTALHLSAGHLLEVADHPADAFNARYLVVEAHHFCNQLAHVGLGTISRFIQPQHEELYRVDVRGLDSGIQYRPPQATPWPRVWGYEAGVIDGEAESDYAQIDDQGRYLVKFHFDESDLKDGKASTWVRMVQPHGGNVEGFHFPLRKGTEVIFNFLGGDPDRPVIAGVVPNAATPSPVTKENRTQNVIRTGGNNKLVIDDEQGAEWIELSTPNHGTFFYMGEPRGHQLGSGFADSGTAGAAQPILGPEELVTTILRTGGSEATDIGTGWFIKVGDAKSEEVGGGGVFEKYDGPHTTLSKERSVIIDGAESYKVQGGAVRSIDDYYDIDVGGGGLHTTVSGPVTDTFKTSHALAVTGPQTFNVSGTQNVSVSGATVHDYASFTGRYRGDKTDIVMGSLTETIAGSYKQTVGTTDWITIADETKITAGMQNEVFVGGKRSFKAAMEANLTLGVLVDLNISAAVKFVGGVDVTSTAGLSASGHMGPKVELFPNGVTTSPGVNAFFASLTVVT